MATANEGGVQKCITRITHPVDCAGLSPWPPQCSLAKPMNRKVTVIEMRRYKDPPLTACSLLTTVEHVC